MRKKINKTSDNDILSVRVDLASFKHEVNEEFKSLKDQISHLPTKDEFYGKMDEVMGELKGIREDLNVTKYHYDKTNKRVDIIDKHLGINTSKVF